MGNAGLRQTTGNQYITQDPRNYFQNDLPKFILQAKIGNGKFMKTYIMRVDGAPVVVKIYMKLNDEDLLVPAANLTFMWKTLSPAKYPNLLPYQMWMRSSSRLKGPATPIYLIRQYINTNLYDRLSTRPFLNELEKLWIIFQLFKCVEICHENGIVHGDLKPENIMCTTSNWVVLTDFSPFKPAFVPDDDPTDFQYYFDCMGRHRCYLAPERFHHRTVGGTIPAAEAAGLDAPTASNNFKTRFAGKLSRSNVQSSPAFQGSQLTPAMDVFALGCIAAEILLDGVPLLDLPGMLKYVTAQHTDESDSTSGNNSKKKIPLSRLDQEESPACSLLLRINNTPLKQVIIDMTQKDPASRLSVSEYLDILQGKVAGVPVVPISTATEIKEKKEHLPATTTESSEGLDIFPSYFDASLYPLFLKMHWNGATPDERVGLICQNYGDLMKSVGSCDDVAGSTFFASALASSGAFRAQAGVVMLSADPTAIIHRTTSASFAGVGAEGRVGDGSISSLPTGGAVKKDLSYRSRGSFLRALLRDKIDSGSAEVKASTNKNQCDEKNLHLLGTDELLVQAAALIAAAEKGTSSPTQLVHIDNSTAAGIGLTRVGDDNILRHGSAAVSAEVIDVTHSVASASWGCNDVDLQNRPVHAGMVVLVDVLFSNYRHLRHPHSKIVCLLLFARIGRSCSDQVILERILPLLLLSIEDQCAAVRAMSIRVLRSLLILVRGFSAAESNIFTLYIFPALKNVVKDHEPVVRVAFAEAVGSIAETAKRFLDITHMTVLARSMAGQSDGGGGGNENKSDSESLSEAENNNKNNTGTSAVEETAGGGQGSSTNLQFPYDQRLEGLREQVSRWVRELMMEVGAGSSSAHGPPVSAISASSPAAIELRRVSAVRRVLLMDVMRLCTFFGQESTVDRLLTQLLTYLNDPDWELRQAFCAKIPSVCSFLGHTVTAECILPFVENAIYDVEEKVVLSALHALTSLLQLRLISNRFAVDFVEKCRALLIHPNDALKSAAIEFVAAAADSLGSVDSAVFLLPQLRPVLRYDISGLDLTTSLLSNAIKSGLNRLAYRHALAKKLASMNVMYNKIATDTPSADAPAGSDVDENLVIIQPYIEQAARDINMRAMNTRPAPPKDKPAVDKDMSTRQNVFSLLDFTSMAVQEHTVQSILVPHQKYGNFLYRPLSDEIRRTTVLVDIDGQKSSNKLRNLYGVTVRQGDSARTTAVGGVGQWDPTVGAVGPDGVSYSASDISAGMGAAYSMAASVQAEAFNVLRSIKALQVPPLPPDTGHLMQPSLDNRPYSSYTEPLDISCSLDGPGRSSWRPKEGVLLTTLKEHGGAVNRIVVSPDQSFFASASSDRTVRIWQTRQLDRVAFPRSSAVYDLHKGEVVDAAPIENSHSIASVSTDGAVHVWRVDMLGSGGNYGQSQGLVSATSSVDALQDEFTSSMTNLTVKDKTQIRYIDPAEGPALCVNHYNSDVCSIVTYATQRGGLHGWDLRAAKEVMHLPVRPELGYATSMTVSPDRNWVCMGTSKGFISLFDIRYNVPNKLWRHSSHGPIHRLACCKAPRVAAGTAGAVMPPQSEGAFLFVAAGNNEAAVWGIPEGGECCKCFRSMPLNASRGPVAPLPVLEEVQLPRHRLAPVMFQDSGAPIAGNRDDAVKAIIGRISQSNMSYLITAGTDRSIRFWDFSAPNRCFTVSGLEAAQPKAIFDAPKLSDGSSGKLFVCYVAATPSIDKILQMHLPVREGRGVVLPSVNSKDAILDMKNIDLPMKLMLSGSRDGEIKLWR